MLQDILSATDAVTANKPAARQNGLSAQCLHPSHPTRAHQLHVRKSLFCEGLLQFTFGRLFPQNIPESCQDKTSVRRPGQQRGAVRGT